MPRTTIILPTYSRNKCGNLKLAIESVLQQNEKDFQLVIVDDGSLDGSKQTIEKYTELDKRVSTIRYEQNVGLPAKTTIKAYLDTDSEFIAWQFDDSVWTIDHLKYLMDAVDECPKDTIIYGHARAFHGKTEILINHELNPERMINGENHIPQGATLVPRSIHETIGWYDPSVILKRFNDMDFWRRCCLDGVKFQQVKRILHTDTGGLLNDSLGNSVNVDPNLIQRYVNHDRNFELHPSRVEHFSEYYLPEELNLDRDYFRITLNLFIDHIIKVGHVNQLSELYNEKFFNKVILGSELEDGNILKFWANRNQNENFDLRMRERDLLKIISEKQAFIDKQQTYIDDIISKQNEVSDRNREKGCYHPKWPEKIKLKKFINFVRRH